MQFNFGGHEVGQFEGTCLQWRRVMLRDAFCANDDVFILLHLDESIDECWDTSIWNDQPFRFGDLGSGQIRGGRKGIIGVSWNCAQSGSGSAFFRFKPSWEGDDNQNHYLLEGRANVTKGEDNLLELKIGTSTISGSVDITKDEWHSVGFIWDAIMDWWVIDDIICLEHSGNVAPETDSTTTIDSGDPWTVSFKANADALVDMTGYDTETGRMAVLYRVSGTHNGIYDGVSYHDNSLLITGVHTYSITSDGSQLICYRDGVQVGTPISSSVGLDGARKWGSDYTGAYDWTENLMYTCIHDSELSLSQVGELHDQMAYTGKNTLVLDGLIVAQSLVGSLLQTTDFTGYCDHQSVYDEIIGFRKVLTSKELIALHTVYLSGTYISPIYHIGNEEVIKINWLSLEPTGYEIEKLEYRCSYSEPDGNEVESGIYDAGDSWGATTDWEILTQGLGVTDQRSFVQFKATLKVS